MFLLAQTDSLLVNKNDKYLEDQLFVKVTYNVLMSQPENVKSSSFSYGVSTGFIKDIPFNKKRSFGIGLGVGYSFNSYNHRYRLLNENGVFTLEPSLGLQRSKKLRSHNIVIPFELRIRTSNKTKYDFWRVYAGVAFKYNFHNQFSFSSEAQDYVYKNVYFYKKWQPSATISIGYDAFNFYASYDLVPIFKGVNNNSIKTKALKLGLVFYIL